MTPIQATATLNTHNTDKYCSADGVIQNADTNGFSGHLIEAKRLISTEKCSSADGVIQQNQKNGSTRDIMVRSADEKSTSADGIISQSTTTTQMMSRSAGDSITNLKYSSHLTISRAISGSLRLSATRTSSLNRDICDTSLSPCLEQNHFAENDEKPPSPPPKPSRTPGTNHKEKYIKDANIEQHPVNRIASYHASGSDSGNGSGDSIQSSATGDGSEPTLHRGVIIKNPKFMTSSASSVTLKSFCDFDVTTAEQELASIEIPVIEQVKVYIKFF